MASSTFLLKALTMKARVQLNAVAKALIGPCASFGNISAFIAQANGPKPIENPTMYMIRHVYKNKTQKMSIIIEDEMR